MAIDLTVEDVQRLQGEAGAALMQATTRAIMAERRVAELMAEVAMLREQLPKDEKPEKEKASNGRRS